MKFYDFEAIDLDGNNVKMEDYKDKVVIVVNTASKCGLSPQFKDLEDLYLKYKDKGLEILGFPCNQFAGQEPGDSKDIQSFCELNYGVTFKMFSKIKVNGEDAHPLWKFLKEEQGGLLSSAIKWNFTKFLIDRNGNVVSRYAPKDNPKIMEDEIVTLLG